MDERLTSKIEVADCWEWTASTTHNGYGVFYVKGKGMARAHRVVYEELVGQIPEGLTLDHLCKNRTCVNPDHLEVTTRGENVRRGLRRTRCKRGHLMEFSTRIRPSGRRDCHLCQKARDNDNDVR